jgi:hypothetical protein
MPHRLFRRSGLLVLAGLLFAAGSSAQPKASEGPDAVDLALAFPRGAFGAPVVCRFGDEVRRGLRRLVIAAGPRTSELRVDRINFFDLGADAAVRCNDDLGAEEPNIVGSLFISYTAKRPRSDTPQRDIDQELKSGPLGFSIVSGTLRIGSVGTKTGSLREVDFAGGKATIGEIAPSSDEARRLGDFASLRQLRLEVTARDGTHIDLPLVEFERR